MISRKDIRRAAMSTEGKKSNSEATLTQLQVIRKATGKIPSGKLTIAGANKIIEEVK